MAIVMSMWSFMTVPSSHKTHQLGIVCCHNKHYSLSALRTSSPLPVQVNSIDPGLDTSKERIRKLFDNVELSVSSYDTACVAMVPCPGSPKSPRFPECVNWLMDNQLSDGSWDILRREPRLLKDSLSSTLACIIALKRWNVGEDQIIKGQHFLESNFAVATNKNQPSPFGFEVIFPCMLEYAKDLNINLPLEQAESLLHERILLLKRSDSKEMEAYLAYITEGLGCFTNWNMVMKYQMENGSLFNSPSATAAAVIHHQNARCLNYLTSLVDKFGSAVPTVYPIDLYVRLCMIDTIERLGITRHFTLEIQNVLNETYRCWMQKDEQIFKDIATCALAFRLLRIKGYEVSADPLAEITKDEAYIYSIEAPFKDVYAAIEVHKASQIMHQEEYKAFREQTLRSIDFLKTKMCTASVPLDSLSSFIHKEVEDNLKFPFNTSLERISTRRNIQNYDIHNTRVLKTIYRSSNISNQDYLTLAVEDFNECQSIFREELKDLEWWVVENKLDSLKFARQKTAYCYFSAASILSSPELTDARISWCKNAILSTVIDDFFDVRGSMDELVNLIQCVEKWNVNVDDDCHSEEVRILFLALKDAISWIGENALKWQARDVTSHVIEIWLDFMKSMLREAIWVRDNSVPTVNEYLENGHVSVSLGPIVLPTLYFVGPKLSENIVQSSEYRKLYELTSTCGRLWNDIQSFKRELDAGKLNAVALHMSHGESGITEEEVVDKLKMLIDEQRRELMKLVLEAKGSVVPRDCKHVFWDMFNVFKFFYATDDGFTGNAILDVVREIIYEPICHPSMPVKGTQENL